MDRRRRTGVPEVVFGEGKTAEQIFALLAELRARDLDAPALATRCPAGVLDSAATRFPGDAVHAEIAATHRRSLERFDFDSVLLPYNFVTMQNPYYAGNFDALYETCRQRRVAMQTIKSIALRPWAGRPHTRATWYEPLEQQDDIDLAVWWAVSRPGVFLDSVGDVDLLPKVLDAASRFAEAPDDTAMRALADRTAAVPLFV